MGQLKPLPVLAISTYTSVSDRGCVDVLGVKLLATAFSSRKRSTEYGETPTGSAIFINRYLRYTCYLYGFSTFQGQNKCTKEALPTRIYALLQDLKLCTNIRRRACHPLVGLFRQFSKHNASFVKLASDILISLPREGLGSSAVGLGLLQ